MYYNKNSMPNEGAGGITTERKEWLSCRDVLWILVFSGFIIHTSLQTNLHVAILAMVIPLPQAAAVSQCKYDMEFENSTKLSMIINRSNVSQAVEPAEIHNYADRLAWNEYQQGLALGGLSWLHWASTLPGGILAQRYGTKFIFGMTTFVMALLGFLLPICARYNLYAFAFIRALQGFLAGFSWPAMHNMTAKWIPVQERSRFISSYLGSSVGIALTFVGCAMLINWFGWESVFYVTSVIGVAWSIAWFYLVHDTPQKHPRISVKEKTYILENMGNTVDHVNSQPVPWKAILTSFPVWLTAIVAAGANWGFFTLVFDGPSYFNYIHGWDVATASVFAAVPHLGRMTFSYVFSMLADWLKRKNRMSTTNVRKFSMLACNGIQSITWFALAFSGCHPTLAIALIITGITSSGSLSAGALSSCIDLSPNYAGLILGIGDTVTWCCGISIPIIVGTLTNDNQTIEQWRLVFLIAAAVPFATVILYTFFGDSELQSWNNVEIDDDNKKEDELRKLKSDAVETDHDEVSIAITRQKNGCRSRV